jgi:hypothetical protein
MDSALGTSPTTESRTTVTERLQLLIANIETNTTWIKQKITDQNQYMTVYLLNPARWYHNAATTWSGPVYAATSAN